MKFAVVTFPGSNCDRDAVYVLRDLVGCEVMEVFHKQERLGDCDAVVIPGGFSYGDYLRAGALATHSAIMPDVLRFAERGGAVIGICNGFQILCEVGLLPGALVRNRSVKFLSREAELSVENADTMFTSAYQAGQKLRIPIAHAEGCYYADDATLRELEDNRRILFRYTGPVRDDVPDGNPNGSANGIAGIMNREGNILGMMPHPERASDPAIGSTDGLGIFQSVVQALKSIPSCTAVK